MEPTITLHKLRVFKEVVERQSLTLAAQELFVTSR
jgi:DNA-binding transcriptional LysR family regulator